MWVGNILKTLIFYMHLVFKCHFIATMAVFRKIVIFFKKSDFLGFYGDFTPVWVQIDVFWSNPNLLGTGRPFQLFRLKNHLITCQTWYKSHKIPILWVKNPTQIGHMCFWEVQKQSFMLFLAHKWPTKLTGVYFMVRISGWGINSCCWAWKITFTSFCEFKTSHFCYCFELKESVGTKTKATENQNFSWIKYRASHIIRFYPRNWKMYRNN